jgi:hypothetical protein
VRLQQRQHPPQEVLRWVLPCNLLRFHSAEAADQNSSGKQARRLGQRTPQYTSQPAALPLREHTRLARTVDAREAARKSPRVRALWSSPQRGSVVSHWQRRSLVELSSQPGARSHGTRGSRGTLQIPRTFQGKEVIISRWLCGFSGPRDSLRTPPPTVRAQEEARQSLYRVLGGTGRGNTAYKRPAHFQTVDGPVVVVGGAGACGRGCRDVKWQWPLAGVVVGGARLPPPPRGLRCLGSFLVQPCPLSLWDARRDISALRAAVDITAVYMPALVAATFYIGVAMAVTWRISEYEEEGLVASVNKGKGSDRGTPASPLHAHLHLVSPRRAPPQMLLRGRLAELGDGGRRRGGGNGNGTPRFESFLLRMPMRRPYRCR